MGKAGWGYRWSCRVVGRCVTEVVADRDIDARRWRWTRAWWMALALSVWSCGVLAGVRKSPASVPGQGGALISAITAVWRQVLLDYPRNILLTWGNDECGGSLVRCHNNSCSHSQLPSSHVHLSTLTRNAHQDLLPRCRHKVQRTRGQDAHLRDRAQRTRVPERKVPRMYVSRQSP